MKKLEEKTEMILKKLKKALLGTPLENERWRLSKILTAYAKKANVNPINSITKIGRMSEHKTVEGLRKTNSLLEESFKKLERNEDLPFAVFITLVGHANTLDHTDVQNHLNALGREGTEKGYYEVINSLGRDDAKLVSSTAASHENAGDFIQIMYHGIKKQKIYSGDFEKFVKIAGTTCEEKKQTTNSKDRQAKKKSAVLLKWVNATASTKGKLDAIEDVLKSEAASTVIPIAEYASKIKSQKVEAMLLEAVRHSDKPEVMGEPGMRKALSIAPEDKKHAEMFAETIMNSGIRGDYLPETFSYFSVLKKRLEVKTYEKMLERVHVLKDPLPFLKQTHKKIFRFQERK